MPTSFKHKVFEAVHGMTHKGVRASRRLLAADLSGVPATFTMDK
jgi:hypothetical protein